MAKPKVPTSHPRRPTIVPRPQPTRRPLPRPPAQAQGGGLLDAIGGFIQSRIDLATGRTPSAISRAMRNRTPVIPHTQRNIQRIRATQKTRP